MAFSFPYRARPWRELCLASIPLRVALYTPFWALYYIPASNRPRAAWSLGRALLHRVFKFAVEAAFTTGPAFLAPCPGMPGKNGAVLVPAAPHAVRGEIRELAQSNGVALNAPVLAYWYGPRGDARAAPGERVILNLHGGGYILETAAPRGLFVGWIRDLIRLPGSPVTRALMPEYRLSSAAPFAPANPFPAALVDALAAYEYLLSLGFDACDITLSGDSAGGHLALTLARYLVLVGLPPPRDLVLLSPGPEWTASSHTGPDASFTRNAPSDYTHAYFASGYIARALALPLNSPWLAPGGRDVDTAGWFAGCPRALLLAGGAEAMLDGIRYVRDRMRADGVQVQWEEVPDATHDWPNAFVGGPLLWEPERARTLQRVLEFLQGGEDEKYA